MADEEQDLEESDPKLTSTDPEERKMARRNRIARRLQNIRRLNVPEGEEIEIDIEKTIIQKQMEKSAELLEKLMLESDELITNVRVANDGREVDRREEEGIGREKIIEQLEEEAESAQEMFNNISGKWTEISHFSDPLAINEEIIAQKEKCDELIKQKDTIIIMLKEQLKKAEIQFTNDQRKQNEDIGTLSHRIEKQIGMMRRAYRIEFKMLEDVLALDRNILLKANDKKWEELYKQREEDEISNLTLRFEKHADYINTINALRVAHAEKYRETKIQLENDVDNLEEELEYIKAVSLLNSEKLDYNYQILAKREDENLIIKSQQKRRINKLQDVINTYRKKISNYRDWSKIQLVSLTSQVQKLQKSVREIESKSEHFSKTNDVKYRQIWDFNYKKAEKTLQEILAIDRILYEQQLGKKWRKPFIKLMDIKDMPSYRNLYSNSSPTEETKAATNRRHQKSSITVDTDKWIDMLGDIKTKVDTSFEPKKNKLLMHILKLISDKSGFLVEQRLKVILRECDPDQRYLVRVDCLFTALDIRSKEDIDDLICYFMPYLECPICISEGVIEKESEREVKIDEIGGEEEHEESESSTSIIIADAMYSVQQPNQVINEIISDMTKPKSAVSFDKISATSVTSDQVKTSFRKPVTLKISCTKNHPLMMNSVYTLRALKDYLTKYYKKCGRTTPALTTEGTVQKKVTLSRSLGEDDVNMYWNKFREVFNSSKNQLWDGLLMGMQKYLEILKDRSKLNEEVISLRRQNMELKHLLASYVEIQKKKKTPPCARQREEPILCPSFDLDMDW